MNVLQILAICGMLSPIIYTLAWIIGGFIVEDYDHIRDDVSSLFAVRAPNRLLFSSFFISCSALSFAFSFSLLWGIENDGSIVGPVLFLISTFIGLLVTLFFPLDEDGKLVTFRGKMHLILIVISGILIMISMIFLWFRMKSLEGWIGFGWFSIVSVPVVLILMAISGKFGGGPYMGLAERFMVSYFQVYYFVIALMVFIRN
ncbi:MAG: DUF998 domain-containing protein [Asgard group archaeon]|nr:DUF998 domain-containing protein [Asgard group archaeon]